MNVESIYNIYVPFRDRWYVYNTASGAFASLNQDYLVESPEALQAGFYVPQEVDEVGRILSLMEKNMNLPIRELDVTVLLTECCNFQCVYCYQDKAKHQVFSVQDITYLMGRLQQSALHGVQSFYIHYFGGEPLLNQPVMFELHRKMKDFAREQAVAYHPVITTNGSLMTKEILRTMQFEKIQLTFDGSRFWHPKLKRASDFGYDDLMQKVQLVLLESDAQLRIRFNLCKENAQSFKETIDEVLSLPEFDWERVEFQIQDLVNRTGTNLFHPLDPEAYAQFQFELYHYLQCRGFKMKLPRALTQPCKFISGRAIVMNPGGKASFCTTESREVNPEDVFVAPHQLPHRREVLPEVCHHCQILPLCLGGCKVRERGTTGCVPFKYTLKSILTDYLVNPGHWRL